MPKIVFVNPNISLEERYGKGLSKGGSSFPPLGVAILAAITRGRGYETRVIDAAAMGLSTEETVRRILDASPTYVGITAVTAAIRKALELAQRLKEECPGLIIILGGAHVTTVPEETMEMSPHIDYGVLGEGEATLPQLLEALERGVELEGIDGLIFKRDGKIRKTSPRALNEDLDSLPMPAWDLLPDLAKYYQGGANLFYQLPTASLVTSRGCPGHCTFCDRTMSGRKLRSYSAPYLMEMVKTLYHQHGVRDIFFYDDNFVVFRKRLMEFCEFMKKEKLGITWACLGRVDMVNPKVLKAMKEAGCWQIGYGIESGSQRVLDYIKKGITLGQIRQAVRWTKDAGIQARGSFMIGLPTQTKEEIEETIDFICELGLDDFHLFTFTPLPGVEILKDIDKYGTFERNWAKQTGWWFDFVPHGLTKEDLMNYHKIAFRRFYFRPRTILSYLARDIRRPAILFRHLSSARLLLRYVMGRSGV